MISEQFDKIIMRRCIELAKMGMGYVAPNPMVGSVIVHNNKIIGEGYHKKYGEAHAEVNAINSVINKSLLTESTIYVTLEPCAHFGKTPPCADLIIKHKIPNIVIGMKDPFAKVNGLGIEKLKNAGCSVKVGILENECKILNKPFITFHEKQRPYIILKWAQTLDGFIDKERDKNSKQLPNWITDEVCRAMVHKWRAESQGIMAGPNTIITDNPKLNVRSWKGNQPIRLIIDRYLRLPQELHIFDKSQETWVFNTKKDDKNDNLYHIKISENGFIEKIFSYLHTKNIQSVFVEGGGLIHQTLINSDLWDEARIFTGNVSFKNGVKAPKINGEVITTKKINTNNLTIIHK